MEKPIIGYNIVPLVNERPTKFFILISSSVYYSSYVCSIIMYANTRTHTHTHTHTHTRTHTHTHTHTHTYTHTRTHTHTYTHAHTHTHIHTRFQDKKGFKKLHKEVPLRCDIALAHNGLVSKFTRTHGQVHLYPQACSFMLASQFIPTRE